MYVCIIVFSIRIATQTVKLKTLPDTRQESGREILHTMIQ
jgi:hypothetical protein